MGKRLLKSLDYVFVLRPTLFFAVWTVFLCGVRAGDHWGTPLDFADPWRFWALAGAASLIMGSVFVVNQLKDIATDLANDKLYLIATNQVPVEHAKIEAFLLLAGGLGCGLLAGPEGVIVAALLFGLGGVAYSYEPFLWKNRPFLGMLVNGGGAVLIFLLGWMARGKLELLAVRYAVPYALAVTGVYLLTTIPDEPGDRVSGKVTFVIRFGVPATTRWAALAVFGAFLGGVLNRDPVIAVPAPAAVFAGGWPEPDGRDSPGHQVRVAAAGAGRVFVFPDLPGGFGVRFRGLEGLLSKALWPELPEL